MICKRIFAGNILNKPYLICLHKVKQFQVLLSNTNNFICIHTSFEHYLFVCTHSNGFKYIKLVTLVEGDPKAPFSIATTPRCRGGHCSILWIAPLD